MAEFLIGNVLGPQGEPGAKGADGTTVAVKLGSTQYNHTGGVINLPAYPTSLPASGGNSTMVNGYTVNSNVPLNAKFTDTVYTHPPTHSISEVSGLQTTLDGKVDDSQVLTDVPLNAKFTDTIVDISGKVDNSRVLTDVPLNAKFTDTVVDISGKADKTYVDNDLLNKVDKVSGKQLSTNDYTTIEKNKLSEISNGAEVNQNAFSNVKIGTTTISADTKSDTLEFVAGTGITLTPNATNDKVTITGVNQYTHPSTHPPSIISQDADNRFVSDNEKSLWCGKQDALGFTPVNTTDSRLSDERTPLTHTHTKSQITDMPTKLSQLTNDIGAGAGLVIITSATEPTLSVGDQWHREI